MIWMLRVAISIVLCSLSFVLTVVAEGSIAVSKSLVYLADKVMGRDPDE